jgi:hypothetical protein
MLSSPAPPAWSPTGKWGDPGSVDAGERVALPLQHRCSVTGHGALHVRDFAHRSSAPQSRPSQPCLGVVRCLERHRCSIDIRRFGVGHARRRTGVYNAGRYQRDWGQDSSFRKLASISPDRGES